MFVIVNEKGELYGGFSSQESKPCWFKTKRDDCQMDEVTADAVIRQLGHMGITTVVKREAGGIIRKWVPADLDVSKV